MNEATKQLAEENGLGAVKGITWTCHVCGDLRPDDKISVAKHVHIYPGDFTAEHNVRYCNDREACRTAAMLRDHTALAFARIVKSNDAIAHSNDVLYGANKRLLRLNWGMLLVGLALGAVVVLDLALWTSVL